MVSSPFTPFERAGTQPGPTGTEGRHNPPHLDPSRSMNCREFRRKHDGYVDDTLSGQDVDAMTLHLRFCRDCARIDTRVRRALLLAHNLPMIEPSAAFGERLQIRLRQERAIMSGHVARHGGDGMTEGRWRPLSMGTYAALAAGVLIVGGLAAGMTALAGDRDPIRLAPVVATLPEREPGTFAATTMIASMPAGISFWPAVFVAQQAPYHFADDAVGR